MTTFVLTSAVLVLLALGYVLRPLWQPRPLAGLGLVAMLALVTGVTYGLIGTPNGLVPAQTSPPTTITEAISRLEAKLERDPDQVEGWRLLGRSYAAEGRLGEARDALAHATKLTPDDPDLLAEAAEARAMAAGGHELDAEAVAMLRHALTVQPMHQRARWFLGVAQRQAKQPAEAAKTWEPLLALVDGSTAASLREQIDAARSEAGLLPLPAGTPANAAPATPTATGSAPATATASINVNVSIDPALAMRVPENAVMFVIARQPNGPPMPVAVEKLAAMQFPLVVTLDDGDSPMPTLKLSQLDRVEILVRISASGDVTARPGDFEATPVLVSVAPHAAAALMIDRVVE